MVPPSCPVFASALSKTNVLFPPQKTFFINKNPAINFFFRPFLPLSTPVRGDLGTLHAVPGVTETFPPPCSDSGGINNASGFRLSLLVCWPPHFSSLFVCFRFFPLMFLCCNSPISCCQRHFSVSFVFPSICFFFYLVFSREA